MAHVQTKLTQSKFSFNVDECHKMISSFKDEHFCHVFVCHWPVKNVVRNILRMDIDGHMQKYFP